MEKVCASCGGDLAFPQKPEYEEELCDDCAEAEDDSAEGSDDEDDYDEDEDGDTDEM